MNEKAISVVRAAEQPLIEGGKSPLVSRRLLTRESFEGAVSVTWIHLQGAHAPQNSGTGNRFYYILTGTAEFSIVGGPAQRAEAGDIVCMPKQVNYVFEGDITYLYVNAPGELRSARRSAGPPCSQFVSTSLPSTGLNGVGKRPCGSIIG